MAASDSVGKVSQTAFKDAEKEALAKIGKVSVPKEVAPKAPSLSKSGKSAANFGVAGNL